MILMMPDDVCFIKHGNMYDKPFVCQIYAAHSAVALQPP